MTAKELDELLKENPTFIISLQNKCDAQEKEIEQLKHKLSVEKSRLNLNIQAVGKIKEQAKEIQQLNFVLKNLTLATNKKINELEEEIKNLKSKV
jgi:predicted RNase H-like nuclease (RuvC/YqgF family)